MIAQVGCDIADPYVEILQQCQIFALDKLNQISRVRITWGDGLANTMTLNSPNGIYKPTHKFSAPGTYPVALTVSTSRGEVKSSFTNLALSNFVPSTPTAVLSCHENLMNVSCSAEGSFDPKYKTLAYTFDWGDGSSETTSLENLSHTYSKEGNYNVSLKVTNSAGFSGFTAYNINAFNSFLRASVSCEVNNLLVSCNSFGSIDLNGNNPLKFKFIFGDGFEETTEGFISTHAYSSPGTYTVKLEIENVLGEKASTETIVMPVKPVNEVPLAVIYCISDTPRLLKCSAENSRDNDGQIVSYKYTWDDQKSDVSAADAEVIHQFKSGGQHEVVLTLTDNDGGISSVKKTFDVLENRPPIASIICRNAGAQKVHCDSISYDPDPNDNIVEYFWSLGDGLVEKTLIPSIDHTYASSSTFNISLEVKDSFGASSIATASITTLQNEAPLASIECKATTALTYQCSSHVSDNDGFVANTFWLIENQKITGGTALYNFTSGGEKEISFTAEDDLGKVTEVKLKLNVPLSSAQVKCYEYQPMIFRCNVESINLDDANDSVESAIFTFDKNELLPGLNVQYEFFAFGRHLIELKIATELGEEINYSQEIMIEPKYLPPVAEFVEEVLMSKAVYFDGSLSTKVDRTVVKYEWEFGDGESLETEEPIISHQFNSYGWFDVKLKVTDATGAVAESLTPIYVYDPEVPDPGEEGARSLEGVDFDKNGIRDDVQRWINQNSFESLVAKRAFNDLALVYKNQIATIVTNDIDKLKNLEDQKALISSCIDGLVIGEHGISKSTEFELVYLNTNARMVNFTYINGKLSGYLPNAADALPADPCANWR